VLRFAFDDPREIGPLLPGVEAEFDDFYAGIQPCRRDDFHGDLMRVTSGQTDPVLSRVLVDNSKDTVFWMHEAGQIKMEPAVSLTGVREGNQIISARGLVVRAEWFAACERLGVEVRYGAAALALLQDDSGRVCGVRIRADDGIHELKGRSVVLGCGGFEANVQMRTQHIGPLVGAAKVRGTPHNQGDGLRMAMQIGAMPWGQWSGCHATPISADWGNFAPLTAAQGIVASTAAGVQVFLEEGAWTKRLHPGWGALAGITAAHLARHGFAGPSRPYEGRFALVRCEAQQDCDFPRYFSGEVIVRMRDGTTHGEHVPVNLGSGERALDAQDIEAKFRGTAGLTLPQDRVNALLDTLMAGGRRKVRAITKLLQVA
jgi:hypothetical protein